MTDDKARRDLFASVLRKNIAERTAEIQRLEEKFRALRQEQVRLERQIQPKVSELRVFLLRHGEVLRKKGGTTFHQSIYARLLAHAGEIVAEAYREATGKLNDLDIALNKLHAERRQNRADISRDHRLRTMHREQLGAVTQGKGVTIILEDGRKAVLPPIVLAPRESADLTRRRERAIQREQEKRANTYSLHVSGDIGSIPIKTCYYIDASNSAIDDDDLVSLTRFVNLKALNLIDTNVTYEGLEHLRMMPILRTLFIPGHLDAGRVKRIFWNNPHIIVNEPKHDWMDHWITVTKL